MKADAAPVGGEEEGQGGETIHWRRLLREKLYYRGLKAKLQVAGKRNTEKYGRICECRGGRRKGGKAGGKDCSWKVKYPRKDCIAVRGK